MALEGRSWAPSISRHRRVNDGGAAGANVSRPPLVVLTETPCPVLAATSHLGVKPLNRRIGAANAAVLRASLLIGSSTFFWSGWIKVSLVDGPVGPALEQLQQNQIRLLSSFFQLLLCSFNHVKHK